MPKVENGILKTLLLGLVLLTAPVAAAADASSGNRLVVGLVPNVSTRTLISAFQPMRQYLEQQLRQPVELYTAPDFRSFYERTQGGEFDLVVTPAHFAWLAIREANYVPLTTYRNPLQGLVIVKQGSAINSARALRGKRVGVVDPLAIVTMRGLQWFQEQGLQSGADFTVHKSAPHNTAALAVANGELDAAIIGSGPYRIMPEDIRAQVRVLAAVGAVPNAIYLANGRLPSRQRKALQGALLAFGDTLEGRRFMDQYGYGGFKTIGAAELKPMEVYSQRVKELLANPGS
jgi:phosphonate transport system substrate-binding protein